MKECTFSPRLNTKYQPRTKNLSNANIHIYDRISMEQEKKRNKLDAIKTSIDELKYQECRFHPERVI